ncbi:MAG: ATP-grasp domain-containing protein [Erysipelotrichaceae bacterium]
MKRGILIYQRADYELNHWFAQEFLRQAEQFRLELSLCFWEDLCVQDTFEDIQFAINRSRDVEIAARLEQQGVRVFNTSKVANLGNDKYEMYLALQAHGFPVVPTRYQCPWDELPFVVKDPFGHGGEQVYRIDSWEAYEQFSNIPHISQPLISPTIGDLRIVVLAEKILTALLRTNSQDFRHNIKQGASVQPFEPTPKMIEVVQALQTFMGMDLGGIDLLLLADGQFYINEIEDVVGVRSVYQTTTLDVVALYLAYIAKEIQ